MVKKDTYKKKVIVTNLEQSYDDFCLINRGTSVNVKIWVGVVGRFDFLVVI